ncbi:MAG: DEAD/DEAH box helicase [Patescibacteria group bacterium]|nr:DEAD/DEAH box helicase [Patescibacteria group bacterium]
MEDNDILAGVPEVQSDGVPEGRKDEEVDGDDSEETEEPDRPTFDGLGLSPKLLESLKILKFEYPTPIQFQAIPAALDGQDVVGIAQTGTGKTLAFGLPMIQRIGKKGGKGLVVLPTRELALQVDEMLLAVAKRLGLRTAVIIGGASIEPQKQAIAAKPHIVIGTPGRIIDHLEQRTLDLSDVSVLVLDEADRMLDMGFLPQIRRILSVVPRERQTMLFSATMPDEVMTIAAKQMKSPVRVEVARAGTPAELVEHELFVCQKDQKNRLLERILTDNPGSVLVFSRTKFGARRICRAVNAMGHRAAEIHSDRSLAQRREALDGFKAGKYRVLVATDIAARGIDVSDIGFVINYDVPENPEDYVHRIGRTGRAGQKGRAITFAMPDQGEEVQQIEMLTRLLLPITPLPELPPDRRPPPGSDRGGRGGRDDRFRQGRDRRDWPRRQERPVVRERGTTAPQGSPTPSGPPAPRPSSGPRDERAYRDRGRDRRDYEIRKPPPIIPSATGEFTFLEGLPKFERPPRDQNQSQGRGQSRYHGRRRR